MTNQRGMITVDFLFAMVLVLGFSGLLFAMTFTLSVASVVQYVTFAAARNYGVAHIDRKSQEEQGQAKYRELIESNVLKPLFSKGWYQISAQAEIGDHTKVFPDYGDAAQGRNQFWGVGTEFVAKALDFRIPFFGASTTESGGGGFRAYMGSYLGRESTTEECIEFTGARWNAIRNLPVSGAASYSTGTSDQGYYPMTDNGC